jgi:hypothetical protein
MVAATGGAAATDCEDGAAAAPSVLLCLWRKLLYSVRVSLSVLET